MYDEYELIILLITKCILLNIYYHTFVPDVDIAMRVPIHFKKNHR